MAKNFKAPGNRMDVEAGLLPAAVSAGDLVVVNDVVGVVLNDGAAGAENVAQVEGAWEGPKVTGASTGGGQGKKAYVIDDGGVWKFTADPTGAIAAGIFWHTCADGDAICQVKLAGTAAVA